MSPRPNDDIDAREILDQVRELGVDLDADKADVSISNKKGLDISTSTEAIVAATKTGNQDVRLNGIDKAGNRYAVRTRHLPAEALI